MNIPAPLAFAVAMSIPFVLAGCATDPDTSPAGGASGRGGNDLAAFGGAGGRAAIRPAGVKPMTVAELTHCAEKVVAMKAEDTSLRREGHRIERSKAVLSKRGEALEQQRGGLDASQARQVREFNDSIQQHQTEARALNADVGVFNLRSATANAEVDRFNVSCAQRVYRPSDLDSLPPALVEAMKAASLPSDVPLADDGEP